MDVRKKCISVKIAPAVHKKNMTGKKTMPLTYDPFFKCMFHPDRHPDWLSNLLSAILGESVVVERLLPSENTAISIDSLLIMDIVVRLSNGSLANVEIQKIPYMFTAERISCYSSDLLLREYTRLKENKKFMYSAKTDILMIRIRIHRNPLIQI